MWGKLNDRPEKEDFVSSSDHEEWENEYYARKSSGGIIGFVCFIAAVLMAFSMAIIKLIMSIV